MTFVIITWLLLKPNYLYLYLMRFDTSSQETCATMKQCIMYEESNKIKTSDIGLQQSTIFLNKNKWVLCWILICYANKLICKRRSIIPCIVFWLDSDATSLTSKLNYPESMYTWWSVNQWNSSLNWSNEILCHFQSKVKCFIKVNMLTNWLKKVYSILIIQSIYYGVIVFMFMII